MSKKLVVKLIATVMALTMVIGNGVVAFAEEGDCSCESPVESDYYNLDATNHWKICTNDGCGKPIASTSEEHTMEIGRCTKCTYGLPDLSGNSHIDQFIELDGTANAIEGNYLYSDESTKNTAPKGAKMYDAAKLRDFITKQDHATSSFARCGHGAEAELTGECLSAYNIAKEAWNALMASEIISDGSKYNSHDSQPSAAPKVETEEEKIEAAAKVVEATIAKETSLTASSFVSPEAVKAIPVEAQAAGASYNISAVTTTQGFVAAVNTVAKASVAAPTVSVYSSKPIAMNAASINAVSNVGKPFIYTFIYKGHIYKVTIPVGAKISTNGQMFMGPLAIGAQLGTTQVVK